MAGTRRFSCRSGQAAGKASGKWSTGPDSAIMDGRELRQGAGQADPCSAKQEAGSWRSGWVSARTDDGGSGMAWARTAKGGSVRLDS